MPKRKNHKSRKQNKRKSKGDDENMRELHTAMQRLAAVHNPTPYKKERLEVDDTQVAKAILECDEWSLFYQTKALPSGGDWLQCYPHERKGQPFNAWYRHIKKNKIWATLSNAKTDSIGLVTCGSVNLYLGKALFPLMDILSEVTECYFFGINVEILSSMNIKDVTSRFNASSNNQQLLTRSIERKLKPIKNKHKNMLCLMGVTVVDLYPDDDWNYVFGEASLTDMTGIFSFARYFPGFFSIADCYKIGDQEKRKKVMNLKKMIDGGHIDKDKNFLNSILNEEEQVLFIRRCLGVVLHEIGHLFGLEHCPYFECLMNGANHLEESDKAPLHLCPICLHKIYFSTLIMERARMKSGKSKHFQTMDILHRYEQLRALYSKYGLREEAEWTKARAEYINPAKDEEKTDV